MGNSGHKNLPFEKPRAACYVPVKTGLRFSMKAVRPSV
jgi:hypothetical protein